MSKFGNMSEAGGGVLGPLKTFEDLEIVSFHTKLHHNLKLIDIDSTSTVRVFTCVMSVELRWGFNGMH